MDTANLVLRLPREDEAEEFLRAHRATSPDFPWFLHFYEEGMSVREYLDVLVKWRSGVGLPDWGVQETLLLAFAGHRIVGRVAIRHRLTAALERCGGHIGYAVVPEFRRRGYATRLLDMSLRMADEQFGIDPILVTCGDHNVGSTRVIERNGGVLHDIVEVEREPYTVRRYWFTAAAIRASRPIA